MGDSGKDDDIERLKKKVINNENTITELKQQVHQLRSENKQLRDDHDKRIRDLEGKKEVLEKENEDFKKGVKRLEDDVRYFSTKAGGITNLQNKVIQDEINNVKKTENEMLKKQVRYVPGAPLPMPVPASEDKTAIVHLGEMCCQIQNSIYKKILPEHFTPITNYKVKSLLRDIEKLSQSEDEKKQALKRWEDLKTDLKWNEDLEKALDALQDTYSRSTDTSPPNLSENFLKDSAKYLARQGIFKGWLLIERVNSLIDVWKRLCSAVKTPDS